MDRVLTTLLSCIFAGSLFAASVPGEYIVKLPEELAPTTENFEEIVGQDVVSFTRLFNSQYKVKVNGQVDLSQPRLSNVHIQPNYIYEIALDRSQTKLLPRGVFPRMEEEYTTTANDPLIRSQWGLQHSKALQAWGRTRGNSEIVVAVLDTGVDTGHEDLNGNIWINREEIAGNGIDDDENGYIDDTKGWDFANNDNDPYDTMSEPRIMGNPGHGTHCAGVVGAVGNNSKGISGVSPNVKIMSLRFITEEGQGTTESAIEAIKYAVDNGARVISNSWGGQEDRNNPDQALIDVIEYARDHDVLMIFAAGNGDQSGNGFDNDSAAEPVVPSSYQMDNILSVAAIDVNDSLAPFSNWGRNSVDIGAPGVQIMSTVPDTSSKYEDQITIFGFPVAPWSGTSMATPHVAGAAALLLSIDHKLSYMELKDALLNSVRQTSSLNGKVTTGGVLDITNALDQL